MRSPRHQHRWQDCSRRVRGPRRRTTARWQDDGMGMTARVKDELQQAGRHQTLLPQVGGGGDPAVRGGPAHRRWPDRRRGRAATANAARRLRKNIADLYGHPSEVLVLAAGGLRKGSRYVVASCRTVRRLLVRPASSTRGDVRCVAAPEGRSVPRLATPRPRGEGRSSRTARSREPGRSSARRSPARPRGRPCPGWCSTTPRHPGQGTRGARRGPGCHP